MKVAISLAFGFQERHLTTLPILEVIPHRAASLRDYLAGFILGVSCYNRPRWGEDSPLVGWSEGWIVC